MASLWLDQGGKDGEEEGDTAGVPASVVVSVLHFPPPSPMPNAVSVQEAILRSNSSDTEAKMGILVQGIYGGNALRRNL